MQTASIQECQDHVRIPSYVQIHELSRDQLHVLSLADRNDFVNY